MEALPSLGTMFKEIVAMALHILSQVFMLQPEQPLTHSQTWLKVPIISLE